MSKRWANRMRTIYITGFVVLIIIIAAPSIYKILTPPLTCTDGLQNQGETAPDLGGPCHYLNPADLRPLSKLWSRAFIVTPGVYSSVAYVENPNLKGGIRKAQYIFKLYDENNILVAERVGEAFIPPGKVVPIFEGNINTGNRVPKRTTFQFLDSFTWEVMKPEFAAEIFVVNKVFKEVYNSPRLSAKVQNKGVYTLYNLVVVATVFDNKGNAIGASRTIVDRLPADSVQDVVFTWPQPFDSPVSRLDVVPLLPPIDSL